MKLHFVGIDWQNDFCDPNGTLFVPGAVEDAERCGAMIHRLIDKIDDIHLTMDSHRLFDVAHPIFWRNSNGENPGPFTIISKKDLEDGVWFPAVPSLRKKAFNYVKQLELNQRYPLCIWPPHCLIGQWGHNIVNPVIEACTAWETKHLGLVDIITKGSNPFTEHYSAVQADVPDPDDPDTALNIGEGSLINILENVDLIALTGQALSHCLANTVRDIANNFGEENIKKMVLIRDCTSSVQGFEQMGEDFIKEMTGRGMQISTADEFLR
jgi:nicotinamidase-related amidase